jgi:hypothetical protein
MTLLILDLILEQNPLKTLASFSLSLQKKETGVYICVSVPSATLPRLAPGRQSPQAKQGLSWRRAPRATPCTLDKFLHHFAPSSCNSKAIFNISQQ